MKITKQMKLDAIRPFHNITGIYSTNSIEVRHKGHWFSADTKRFFKSRVLIDAFPSANGKVYFVSSEATGFNTSQRGYTVRAYNLKEDSIETVGEFNGYETKTQALSAALSCAYDGLDSLHK